MSNKKEKAADALAKLTDEQLGLLSDHENAGGRATLNVTAVDVAAEIARRKGDHASPAAPEAAEAPAENDPASPAPEPIDPAAENKEFGTSDLSIEDQLEAQRLEAIEKGKELVAAKQDLADLTVKQEDLVKQLDDARTVISKRDSEIGDLSDALDRWKRRWENNLASAVAPQTATPPAPSGRTLAGGTRLQLGEHVLELVYPALVRYPNYQGEQQFVGMLLGSTDPEANFEANKTNLRLIYSRSTGGPVPYQDQSDRALENLDDHELRTLGITEAEVDEELRRRAAAIAAAE